jgi:hypothetical protein
VAGTYPEAKIAGLYGVLYHFLAKAGLDRFGDEGEDVLRRALGDFARREANSLNEDEPAQGWEVHGATLSLGEEYSTVAGWAVYDAWREIEGDEIPIGLVYLKEMQVARE